MDIAIRNGYESNVDISQNDLISIVTFTSIVTSKPFIDAFARHLWNNAIKEKQSKHDYRHIASRWEDYKEADPSLRYGAYKWIENSEDAVVNRLVEYVAKAIYNGTLMELLERLSREDPWKNPFIA